MAQAETIAAMREALAWLSLLGDHIGNGVTEDRHKHGVPLGPMGRCNAISRLRDAIEAEADPLPRPCCDCINTHGDDPAAWLSRWPAGAAWHPDLKAHLCDGCADERRSWAEEEPDPYDLPPYADGY
jgi:hypothetical protein